MLVDERILEFIKKKHENEKDFDLEKYLNPSLNDLRDANKLKDIDLAAKKIKDAINDGKRILVYGDYDSDGICAVTILYLHLKNMGANVDVFIPNRFENGYGMSVEAIEEIVSEFAPDLVVTVDLGITAIEEVEILKQEGIDVVVTDHHLPLAEVPDCIIIDPKHDNAEYGFDGLCGAGVAYKLVEALSGKTEANKYLDICAIATVGDIVPLIDENRVIAKFGIDKINNGECLKSLTFLKNKLELERLTSTDISFKIVPRLNACGRMDNALKVFEFLIQTEDKLLEEKYAEIESDNTLRLATIDKGTKIIDELMKKYNFDEPSILVHGDFHEGTIGIVASRLCHDYNKPAIVFAKTEDGTLKGSGRSIDKVDLHKIISGMGGMLLNFGGHKMAVGLEIEPENFEVFKEELNKKILEITTPKDFLIDNSRFDIKITDDDLSIGFAKQLEKLEPFGDCNEKPLLMLEQEKMSVMPISEKAFKHYKCFTAKNNALVAFNFYKDSFVCESPAKKQIIVDLSLGQFKGKDKLNLFLKGLSVVEPKFETSKENDFMTALYNKYYSVFDFNNRENYVVCEDLESVIKTKFAESEYGTILVATTGEDLEVVKRLGLEKYVSEKPLKNGQNVVVVSPRQIYELADVFGYKNIIFLHKYFDEEHLFYSQRLKVYENAKNSQIDIKISKEREIFAKVYKLATAFVGLKANDVLDFSHKLSLKDGVLSASQILFSLIVFMELNFLEFDDVLCTISILKSKKTEITSSKFYQSVVL